MQHVVGITLKLKLQALKSGYMQGNSLNIIYEISCMLGLQHQANLPYVLKFKRCFPILWKRSKTICFSCCSLLNGKPGYSLVPATVHRFMTSSPKIASLGSITKRVDALESVLSLEYFIRTTFISTSFSVLMTDDGNVLSELA